MIETEWNLKVWQNGNKIWDKDHQHTFENDEGYVAKVKKNDEQTEYYVIVTIKNGKLQTPNIHLLHNRLFSVNFSYV